MIWGWRFIERKFSKVNCWGKNSYAKRQVYVTLTDGPIVNVFNILVFVTSSSNMIAGVWSNVLRIAPLDNPTMLTPISDQCFINRF